MAVRVYIASTLSNAEAVKALKLKLNARGYEITYDWTAHGGVWAGGEKVLRETAMKEMSGVEHADFVIILLPGGRGTHFEMGAALALGKRVFLVGDRQVNADTVVFHWHPGVEWFRETDLMLMRLEQARAGMLVDREAAGVLPGRASTGL